MRKSFFLGLILILISSSIFLVIYTFRFQLLRKVFKPSSTDISSGVSINDLQDSQGSVDQVVDSENIKPDFEVVAEDLEIPWEVAFLPTDEILITERPGRLLKIGVDRQIIEVEGVTHIGEGGLLGMALHPNFFENNWIYLYLTSTNDKGLVNRVERYRLENDKLTNKEIIVEEIPGARFHDGGRIEFGPDGYLYISTGDAGNEDESQNKNSLNGTILRVKDDGSVPEGNPFGTVVYSYGHRNVQGITWDDEGRMWVTEHGRSGIKSGFDELNLIEAGGNYGWPVVEGDESQKGLIAPVLHSGASDTWAPAGGEFVDGIIFFAGLRGEALYAAKIEGEKVTELKMHFREELGRLRAVKIGPDGYLYITTSNRDGRGEINKGDDKLIKINPASLK